MKALTSFTPFGIGYCLTAFILSGEEVIPSSDNNLDIAP